MQAAMMTYRQVIGGLVALVAFLAGGIAPACGRELLSALKYALAAGEANLNALNPHAYSGLNQEASGGRNLLSDNANDLVSSDR